MQRMGMVIRLKADRVADDKTLRAVPKPEMDAALRGANIQNYSIFLQEPENILFGYREDVRLDYQADVAALGAREVSKRWLTLTDACQIPMGDGGNGWSVMEQVYRLNTN